MGAPTSHAKFLCVRGRNILAVYSRYIFAVCFRHVTAPSRSTAFGCDAAANVLSMAQGQRAFVFEFFICSLSSRTSSPSSYNRGGLSLRQLLQPHRDAAQWRQLAFRYIHAEVESIQVVKGCSMQGRRTSSGLQEAGEIQTTGMRMQCFDTCFTTCTLEALVDFDNTL